MPVTIPLGGGRSDAMTGRPCRCPRDKPKVRGSRGPNLSYAGAGKPVPPAAIRRRGREAITNVIHEFEHDGRPGSGRAGPDRRHGRGGRNDCTHATGHADAQVSDAVIAAQRAALAAKTEGEGCGLQSHREIFARAGAAARLAGCRQASRLASHSRTRMPPLGTGGPGGAKGSPVARARASSEVISATRHPPKCSAITRPKVA